MVKEIVKVENAPAALGPYSQAVIANGFLFISGQIPIDPVNGEMEKDDVRAATDRCLQNIKIILNDQGLTFTDVVKNTVYLTDMDHFNAMNDAYAMYFRGNAPARACVAVVGLPKGALVEIECLAAMRLDDLQDNRRQTTVI